MVLSAEDFVVAFNQLYGTASDQSSSASGFSDKPTMAQWIEQPVSQQPPPPPLPQVPQHPVSSQLASGMCYY